MLKKTEPLIKLQLKCTFRGTESLLNLHFSCLLYIDYLDEHSNVLKLRKHYLDYQKLSGEDEEDVSLHLSNSCRYWLKVLLTTTSSGV